MTKLQVVILIVTLALTVAISQARAPAKRVSSRLVLAHPRTRALSRQEVFTEAEVAVTPYPSADELKPRIAFDEAAEVPVEAGPLPNEFYGPPDLKDNHIPDEIYGPPEQWLPADEASLSFEQQARLVAVRRSAALHQHKRQAYRQLAAAKLSLVRPAKLKIISAKRLA